MRLYLAGALLVLLVTQSSGAATAGTPGSSEAAGVACGDSSDPIADRRIEGHGEFTDTADRFEAMHAPAPRHQAANYSTRRCAYHACARLAPSYQARYPGNRQRCRRAASSIRTIVASIPWPCTTLTFKPTADPLESLRPFLIPLRAGAAHNNRKAVDRWDTKAAASSTSYRRERYNRDRALVDV